MRIIITAIHFDHLTFSWCHQRRCRRYLVAISRKVSRSADGHLYGLLGLLAWSQGYYHFLVTAVTAFVAERGCYFVLKNKIQRNRPPDAIPGFESMIKAADRFSFPSGHTSAAFLMATLLYSHFPGAAWFMYPWACCVAGSRVMLGVHFPTDTLAGATLGTSVAMGSQLLVANQFTL
ncbi:phosphatase PAP2 family protein [Proteobacteria bacterium 005FR1]|nr:phosphatase PAP2 family protein [Proteobacteria bacterium 005FR1]